MPDAEHYRRFFEELADGAFVVDQATGRILEANAAAARAYGYTREEVLTLTVAQLSSNPERALEAARRGLPLGGPRLHRRKNGTTFLADISISRAQWDGRAVLIGIVRDVTVLANTFHTSPLLMSVSDLQTDHYLEVNSTFCERVGFTREEMVGKSAVELGLITEAERHELANKLMAAGTGAIEFSIRSRAGEAIACRYWGQILDTPEGPRLFATAEDVTELRTSDERFELAMDATTDGLWDWDIASERA
jgi:PAS domain S-box-containing protein